MPCRGSRTAPVMSEVVLHIGAFKTGTTFIQESLFMNQSRLRDLGVLVPGNRWADQAAAARALIARGDSDVGRETDAWDHLADECRRWTGSSAVISMEFLAGLGASKVEAVVTSLQPGPITVVLGARDLLGLLPAQWQTSIRGGGRVWTFGEYAAGVTATRPRRSAAGRHFWRRHDWPAIARRWGAFAGPDRVRVVPLPGRGSDPSLLWWRFGAASGLPTADLPPATRKNESMGAASGELVRRLNVRATADSSGLSVEGDRLRRRWVRDTLCSGVLIEHKALETPLRAPADLRPWATSRAETLMTRLDADGVQVVGDVADLLPPAGDGPERHPRPPTEHDILRAGEFALDRLAPDVLSPARPGDEVEWLAEVVEVLYRLSVASAA